MTQNFTCWTKQACVWNKIYHVMLISTPVPTVLFSCYLVTLHNSLFSLWMNRSLQSELESKKQEWRNSPSMSNPTPRLDVLWYRSKWTRNTVAICHGGHSDKTSYPRAEPCTQSCAQSRTQSGTKSSTQPTSGQNCFTCSEPCGGIIQYFINNCCNLDIVNVYHLVRT